MTMALHRLRVVAAGAILAASPLLSGCVAAIPALAATTMMGKDAIKDKRPDPVRGLPRVAIPADPEPVAGLADPAVAEMRPATPIVRTQEFADGSTVEVTMPAMRGSTPAVAVVPAEPESSDPAPEMIPVSAPASTLTTAPLSPVVREATSASVTSADYSVFARYAAAQGELPIIGSERRSAMLENPGSLTPAAKTCSIQPAAVMIDLDPAGGTLDPVRAMRGDPALSATLASLRASDIAIAWVSSVTADRAGAVRKALVASALDPTGQDELVLLRFPEERKQTRRRDLAKELCVVAIAGDERADFDELFEYLKDPATAAPLDALIGAGWFLIPTPLS